MTTTKTKEFMAEMKVLCKVHHANLVMLSMINNCLNCEACCFLLFKTIDSHFGLILSKVELIGYAASDNELFLIYEYAQKGSLKSHLHDPQNKGKIIAVLS